jgi:RHS repeat-associated protein
LKHKGYNNQINGVDHQRGYLRQEENDELGLGWLTFRHRNYMPEIGRFFGVDPVSADYVNISTYQFAHNNPIWKIEIEGLEGHVRFGVDVLNAPPSGNSANNPSAHIPLPVGNQSGNSIVRAAKRASSESSVGGNSYKTTRNMRNESFGWVDVASIHKIKVASAGPVGRHGDFLYDLVKQASRKEGFEGGSGNNGVADAAKHTYSMAILSAEHGEDVAWDIGLANEYQNEVRDEFSENMDFNNNDWGIKWGEANIKKDSNGNIISFDIDKYVTDLFNAIESGDVIIKDSDKHYVTDELRDKIIKQINYFSGNIKKDE